MLSANIGSFLHKKHFYDSKHIIFHKEVLAMTTQIQKRPIISKYLKANTHRQLALFSNGKQVFKISFTYLIG